jgi:hypothetical protein
MTALTPVIASRLAGADLSPAAMTAASNGDTFPVGPNTFLRVKNLGGTICAVTVTVGAAGSGPLGTSIVAMALLPSVPITTGDRLYGPFPAYPFGDANGLVTVTYSFLTTVWVQAITVVD